MLREDFLTGKNKLFNALSGRKRATLRISRNQWTPQSYGSHNPV